MNKKLFFYSLFISGFLISCTHSQIFRDLKKVHPRLVYTDQDLQKTRHESENDTLLKQYINSVLIQADACLTKPLPVFKKGKMKAESQDLVDRAYLLGFAWRWTHKKTYSDFAIKNAVQVCSFEGWGADFLNKSEMAHGVSIIYDWFYPVLNEATKKTIENALIEKAIKPAMKVYKDAKEIESLEKFTIQQEDSFGIWKEKFYPLSQAILRRHNKEWLPGCNHNWNVVCNSGNIIASLAIADKFPGITGDVIGDALQSVKRAIKSYANDGVWGEGPFLWEYTTINLIYLLSSLQTALNTDYGLSSSPGISNTADYINRIKSPAGKLFSFADNPQDLSIKPNPSLFWFANFFSKPYLAGIEHQNIIESSVDVRHVIWYHKPVKSEPVKNDDCFKGPVDIAVFCNNYSEVNSLFLACKAGYNQYNHTHLDLGTFVFDFLGERWAEDLTTKDLGKDNFKLPDYWDGSPKGRRWENISANSYGHNICILNNKQQDAYAKASIVKFYSDAEKAGAVIDLSKAYPDAYSVFREFKLTNNRHNIEITDSFHLKSSSEIKWQMMTKAVPVVRGQNEIELQQSHKKISLKILEPVNYKIFINPVKCIDNKDITEDFNKIEITSKDCKENCKFRIELALVP